MTSGTRRAVPSSSAAQERLERGELDWIRARLERGEITMRDAQREIAEMILQRSVELPDATQRELRALLLDAVDHDPYFALAREVTAGE